MKMTKDVQIAIAFLKALSVNERLNLSTVAKMKGVSLYFLELVARKLRVAGFVKSHRGPGGGYSLLKHKTTVAQVMKALGRKLDVEVLESSIPHQRQINTLLESLQL